MNTPKMPTDRSFGVTFAVVFALAGGWFAWRSHRAGLPLLGLATVFALLAVAIPRVLHPLNVVWMHLGNLLGMVVSPIVLGIMFYGMLTPVALFFRIRGKDTMQRTFDKNRQSYWIERSPPPGRSSFPRQF